MFQQIINQVEPVVISAAVAILTAAITAAGTAFVQFIQAKKAAVVQKMGVDNYNQKLAFAKQAWAMVDETFRITPALEKTIAAKQEAFAAELEKLVPDITAEEIEQLRQAVAGEVNKGRAVLTAPADTPTVQATPAVQSATSTEISVQNLAQNLAQAVPNTIITPIIK